MRDLTSCLLLLVSVSGCAPRGGHRVLPMPVSLRRPDSASWCRYPGYNSVTVDSTLFEMVVAKVLNTSHTPVRVTPWPLGDSPLVDDPTNSRPDPTWRAITISRSAILKRRNVPEVEDAAANACPAGAQLVSAQPGCPHEQAELVAIGIARHGGAYFPQVVDNRAAGDAQQLCAMRVILTNVAPGGRLRATLDYLFQRDGSKWQYVDAVTLVAEP
jgi:hypothetical protein